MESNVYSIKVKLKPSTGGKKHSTPELKALKFYPLGKSMYSKSKEYYPLKYIEAAHVITSSTYYYVRVLY